MARRMKGDWVLVRQEGMANRVLSVHTTKEAAENAMRKKGGEPDSLFRNGMTILDAGPTGSYELLELDGRYIIRPDLEKRRRNQQGLSGIGGVVAGMFGAAGPVGSMDDVIAEMRDLTDANQHTTARLVWAKWLAVGSRGNQKWVKVLTALEALADAYGYLPPGGSEIQREASRALYRATEQGMGKAIAEQFNAAL